MKDTMNKVLGEIEVWVVLPYYSTEIEGETHVEITLSDIIKLLERAPEELRKETMRALVERFGDGRD